MIIEQSQRDMVVEVVVVEVVKLVVEVVAVVVTLDSGMEAVVIDSGKQDLKA